MRNCRLWAVALIALLPWAVEAAKVDSIQVKSAGMNKEVKVVVVAPEQAAARPCPVIYLLHGYSDNQNGWIEIKPDLPQIADEKGIIFVCPDGKNSWYWNSPMQADVRYEDFISKELVSYIDSHYSTIANRDGRAITGLSMGGHGALWNAIRHSDVFGAAGSTSGGLDIRPSRRTGRLAHSWATKRAIARTGRATP